MNSNYYDITIRTNNKQIKKIKRAIKWTYLSFILHVALVFLNIPPFVAPDKVNTWNIIAASCWGLCIFWDYWNWKKHRKSIVSLEEENLDILKNTNHSEWVKVMRAKKLSRVLD